MVASSSSVTFINNIKDLIRYINKKKFLYILLFPCVVYYIVFHYIPMYGVTMAFKDFSFTKGILGSPWIGLDNFKYMFSMDSFYKILFNSFYLSLLSLFWGFPVPIILALLLNEIRSNKFKRVTQTIVYLPHFISWAILGAIIINFLSPNWGVVNFIIKSLGFEPIFFLANEKLFRPIIILSAMWKEAGWGTIIYLAALSNINPELYEAGTVDGANRWQKLIYITFPCLTPTIIMLLILSTGHIMDNSFVQIFIFQNPKNLGVSEVLETYTYNVGLLGGRYSFAAAVGIFKSLVGLFFVVTSNKIAKLFGQEGIY